LTTGRACRRTTAAKGVCQWHAKACKPISNVVNWILARKQKRRRPAAETWCNILLSATTDDCSSRSKSSCKAREGISGGKVRRCKLTRQGKCRAKYLSRLFNKAGTQERAKVENWCKSNYSRQLDDQHNEVVV